MSDGGRQDACRFGSPYRSWYWRSDTRSNVDPVSATPRQRHGFDSARAGRPLRGRPGGRVSTRQVLRWAAAFEADEMSPDFGFAPRELRALRALRTPVGIQRALEAMPYHLAGSAWSPRRVLREGTAHCLEGAIFAAAALRVLGWAPLLLDLEAVQDTDHVISVYRVRGHWGAIAKSNFSSLRFREPVY